MIIGYNNTGYSTRRSIIGAVSDVDYKRVRDMYWLGWRALAGFNKLVSNKFSANAVNLRHSFNDFGSSKVDVMHLFNAISYGRTPWISTFETIIPRFNTTLSFSQRGLAENSGYPQNEDLLYVLDTLSSVPCKRLIALSKCNFDMQKRFLETFPQDTSDIEKKLMYLHPPQKKHLDTFSDKNLVSKKIIHFMMVGNAFFRKGGMEILNAFVQAKEQNGYELKLTIVSSLSMDYYAAHETEADVEKAKKLIASNSSWIDYYHHLPNHQVLDLMKAAHVGLLPTYADTYGYSVLEFQSCGCPVISTNVRAQGEINNDNVGWLINVPKNELGEAFYNTKAEREMIKSIIESEIVRIIDEIMNDTGLIENKSNSALNRLEVQHSPALFESNLKRIYHDSFYNT